VNPGKHGFVILILLLALIVTPVTATVYFTPSAPRIITKGDPFSISGTGAVNGTVAIWIVGRDHFEILTTAPDRHGNFSITIKPSATNDFSSGQYGILLQDPGSSGILELEGGTDINDNLVVMNRGKIITRLGYRQDLGENIRPVVEQIQSASSTTDSRPNISLLRNLPFFLPDLFLLRDSGFRTRSLVSASLSREQLILELKIH